MQNATILNKPQTYYEEDGRPGTTDTVIEDETGRIFLCEQYEGEYLPNFNIGDKIKILGAFLLGEGYLMLDTYGSIARA